MKQGKQGETGDGSLFHIIERVSNGRLMTLKMIKNE